MMKITHCVLLQVYQRVDNVTQHPVIASVSVARDRRCHRALALQTGVWGDGRFRIVLLIVVVQWDVSVQKRQAYRGRKYFVDIREKQVKYRDHMTGNHRYASWHGITVQLFYQEFERDIIQVDSKTKLKLNSVCFSLN